MSALRVGLIARAEDRGLGLQTWEVFRHLRPRATVVVDMGKAAGGFPMHLDRYGVASPGRYQPGVGVARLTDGRFTPTGEEVVRAVLDRCDVVYTAETFYDDRLPTWAVEARCRVVVHVNPEFFRWGDVELGSALRWWLPTPWRQELLPASARLVPVPVATDRFADPSPWSGPLRVLHVAGRRAAHDRNGTVDLLRALRLVKEPMVVTLRSQGDSLPVATRLPGHVEVVVEGGARDYWRLYEYQDVLVMPRRYGGLCLPVQEAQAAGLAVVMPAVEPNSYWAAAVLTSARVTREFTAPAGPIGVADSDPVALARVLDSLARDHVGLESVRRHSLRWAERNSWQALTGLYLEELARAASD